MRTGAVGIVLLLSVGCGARSHAPSVERDDAPSDADSDVDSDTGPGGDASADSDADTETHFDSDSETGSESEPDSDTDTGAPDDEPDLGPGARPSDYPEADDWTDTENALGPGDPCCELVGDPLELPATAYDVPAVAWSGGEWGVAWAPLGFQAVDALGAPIDDPNWTAAGFSHLRM